MSTTAGGDPDARVRVVEDLGFRVRNHQTRVLVVFLQYMGFGSVCFTV